MTVSLASLTNGSVQVDGRRLKQLRKALGWTQETVALKAGYTDRLIRKLERGGPVAARTLRDVLDAYREHEAEIHVAALETFVVGLSSHDLEYMIRSWFERAFNQRDVQVVDELIHENVVLYAEGQTLIGRDHLRQRVNGLLAAFDPLQITVENVLLDGNTTVAYWTVRKKHIGEFLGIPPTQKWASLKGSSLTVFESGQIIQARDHWDVQHLIDQLSS